MFEKLKNLKENSQDELIKNLELVFDHLHDGLVLLSVAGKILYINDFLLDLGGYTRQELLGKNAIKLANIFSPTILKKFAASFLKVGTGVDSEQYEVEAKTKNGGKKTLELVTSVVKKDGKILGVAVVARDPSEREKLAE